MFKTLYLSNFAIKLFLEEKLLALKVNISNIDPTWPKTYPKFTLVEGKHQLMANNLECSG